MTKTKHKLKSATTGAARSLWFGSSIQNDKWNNEIFPNCPHHGVPKFHANLVKPWETRCLMVFLGGFVDTFHYHDEIDSYIDVKQPPVFIEKVLHGVIPILDPTKRKKEGS